MQEYDLNNEHDSKNTYENTKHLLFQTRLNQAITYP